MRIAISSDPATSIPTRPIAPTRRRTRRWRNSGSCRESWAWSARCWSTPAATAATTPSSWMPSRRVAASIAVSPMPTISFTERDFESLHAGGCRGVRFNFVKHLGGVPDMDEFQRVIARMQPLGWHVDLHFDAVDLVEFAALLHRLPVPFIIDHMGRVPTKDGLAAGAIPAPARSGASITRTAGSRSAAPSASPALVRRSPMRCRSRRR